ncbi:hypothetical protein [Stratiformator vulcanicus]|uniref:Uncharacterized protein n=1 Tax=Stratiformator vulcanicus TaxID=2527980 RepID=A0A517R0V0_9PLAN|nr:hypothetical protein [Stratiformator vulcanicus]QDT37463.1 hypothetical protein Pan189_18430 [Stratiformator vulcanicus]
MRRLQIGIFAAAVIGVAALLNGLMNGFGLGEGDGGTTTVTEQTSTSETESESVADDPDVESSEIAESDGSLDVLIDDREFLVRGADSGSWVPIDLSKLVSLIAEQPGDDGLKATIYRTPAARAAAEEELQAAMSEAGIEDSAVDQSEKFIER